MIVGKGKQVNVDSGEIENFLTPVTKKKLKNIDNRVSIMRTKPDFFTNKCQQGHSILNTARSEKF